MISNAIPKHLTSAQLVITLSNVVFSIVADAEMDPITVQPTVAARVVATSATTVLISHLAGGIWQTRPYLFFKLIEKIQAQHSLAHARKRAR